MRSTLDTPVLTEFPNFNGIAAVTSGTEINLWNPALYSFIPANDAEPGCGYELTFGGIYGNRTTTSPASTWRVRWGTNNASPPTGTLIGAASNATYMGAASTAKRFYGKMVVVVLAVGATGSAVANGIVTAESDTAGTWKTWTFGGGPTTIDTTVDAGIGISHVWSATNASNTLTCQWAHLRSLG